MAIVDATVFDLVIKVVDQASAATETLFGYATDYQGDIVVVLEWQPATDGPWPVPKMVVPISRLGRWQPSSPSARLHTRIQILSDVAVDRIDPERTALGVLVAPEEYAGIRFVLDP